MANNLDRGLKRQDVLWSSGRKAQRTTYHANQRFKWQRERCWDWAEVFSDKAGFPHRDRNGVVRNT
eukprot:7961490-Lingulodinium_polyedra.AAC.1